MGNSEYFFFWSTLISRNYQWIILKLIAYATNFYFYQILHLQNTDRLQQVEDVAQFKEVKTMYMFHKLIQQPWMFQPRDSLP